MVRPLKQFGIEVGGLLRQDLAGEGDLAHLVHADRIDHERDIGAVSYTASMASCGVTHVFQMLLIANVFLRHSQRIFQNQLVQLHDVECALAF